MNNSTELPRGREKVIAVRDMFDRIAPRYELVNRVITFGLDNRWRNKSLHLLSLAPNSLILDIACGTGDFCRLLENQGHRPVGIDMSLGMLQAARTNAPLIQADALALPFADSSVDGVTCGFALRNFENITDFIKEIARVVRPGGRVAVLDAYRPDNKLLRFGHSIYFGKFVPIIGGAISDRAAYGYLPNSLEYLPPIKELLQVFEVAGFQAVTRHEFLAGSAHLITATRS